MTQIDKSKISIGLRILSGLLDHLILFFILGFLANTLPYLNIRFLNSFDVMVITFSLSTSLYFNKDVFYGRSLAKRLLKLQIIDYKTQKIASPLKCLLRNFTALFLPIEVILILISPKRRLGDLLAGTALIKFDSQKNDKPKLHNQLIGILLIIGLTYLFSFMFSDYFNEMTSKYQIN